MKVRPCPRLSKGERSCVLALYGQGVPAPLLARRFGISLAAVYRIVNRKAVAS